MAIVVDAISYLVDAALIASIRVDEPRPDSGIRNLRAEIRDGLQWTYRHRTLGPLAVSTHVWFLANGAATTVLSLFALRSLGFTAYTFGLLLAVFGVTSLVGASIAPRIGARVGSGRSSSSLARRTRSSGFSWPSPLQALSVMCFCSLHYPSRSELSLPASSSG